MSEPVPPKGYELSRDWWLSGSADQPATADHVYAALGVYDKGDAERRAAVQAYYRRHPDRRQFVPPYLVTQLGL